MDSLKEIGLKRAEAEEEIREVVSLPWQQIGPDF
jgi:hypothetical protein